ncbi:hypothetical protein ACHAW5_000486 [Stephanodiscus triporus]|uniref:Uncharacterized protein n=1 Tax=Stephanodiscus triporus TaxID=2934178 RepID=A0ABD3MKL2_9STRA
MSAKWMAILALPIACDRDGGGGLAHALSGTGGKTNFVGRRKTGGGGRILEIRPSSMTVRHRRSSDIVLSSSSSSSSATTSPSSELDSDGRVIPQTARATTETKTAPTELYSVDVRYDRRSQLIYDAATGRYLDIADAESSSSSSSSYGVLVAASTTTNNERDHDVFIHKWGRFLHSAFVPEGVSQSYYSYVRWRILQRFVNANVHVIGTQSLLMGLRGMQQGRVASSAAAAGGGGAATLGAAAATNWVLKDTLGKVVRMAWASRMGRKFDPDAKRWRFRASLIYALGNGLEVSTYLHPQYFLVLAMLANSCKQMSMLTSSATRNAIYNSFRRIDNESSPSPGGVAAPSGGANGGAAAIGTSGNGRRGSGGVENIGDITAKGEAQIAVVDLLGIVSGICLSRAVGVSVQNVFAIWVILQIAEIFCMYHEMRSVEYKTFNFERMYTVLGDLMLDGEEIQRADDIPLEQQRYKFTGRIPTPRQIAAKEKIFLPPDHLARRAIAFGSPGRTLLDPEELDMLINDVFRGEKYFLVVGQDVKNARGLSSRARQWMRRRKEARKGSRSMYGGIDPQEQCHIVLHADANNLDILKSALALVILRKKLVKKVMGVTHSSNRIVNDASSALRSRDCIAELRGAGTEANEIFPQFLRELTKQGWRPPLRSMLGRVSARADWPIQRR